jgi:hypothetical protein
MLFPALKVLRTIVILSGVRSTESKDLLFARDAANLYSNYESSQNP